MPGDLFVQETRARADAATGNGATPEMLVAINALRAEGTPEMGVADVFVRGAWVCNDQRDHYDTRFSAEALAQIAEYLPGEPVMTNHDRDDMPVARWFQAERVQREDGSLWVRGLFFWAAAHSAAADMAAQIDSGVWSEVSVAWFMRSMTCSVCARDISDSACPHVPGKQYDGALCVAVMSDIVSVEEASLVWKGGQIGTSLFKAAAALRTDDLRVVADVITAKRETPDAWSGFWERISPMRAFFNNTK